MFKDDDIKIKKDEKGSIGMTKRVERGNIVIKKNIF